MHDRLVSRRIDALHQCFLVLVITLPLDSAVSHISSLSTRYCPCKSIIPPLIVTYKPEQNLDPDQTPRYAASDQGLHSLPFIQPVLAASISSKKARSLFLR